jgi:tripartite-type tricarboxylate transporter receptor subunit TctC
LVVVHPSLPVKSIKELIALAKAKPGELNYGKSTPGGTPHLGGERLNSMAGIKLVAINYKGSGDIATAVMGNQVHVGVISVASASAGVKSGRLKPLAVTSLKPSAMAPGVPTVAETGLPGYEVVNIDSMFAPAKTPVAIVKHLNREIVRFLQTRDTQERYLVLGSEVVASSPAELLAKIKFNMTTVRTIDKLIKDAGI